MKKNNEYLNIFCLSHHLKDVEWSSLLGDKYQEALPFQINLVEDLSEAHIIAWDGIISPKISTQYDQLLKKLEASALLLLMGETRTLLRNHPFVKSVDTTGMRVVELPGWSILPEELLAALQSCWEKLKNV